jgi:uncharacterized repeat protein (TIGR04052 family)
VKIFTLIAAFPLIGCSPPPETIEIPFTVRYGDSQIDCNTPQPGVAMSDLRFYAHAIRLINEAGDEIEISLTPDDIWQSDEVALLDFENGEGACLNGSPQTHMTLRGQIPPTKARGLRFEIGVPKDLNHADPLLAGAPLAYTAMHWHWKSGYKFLRAGVNTADDDGFWMHLGSARCAGTVGNILGCESPNRASVDLPNFEPGKSVVVIDLQRLTSNIDLRDRHVTECQSGPAETECAKAFPMLGLDFDTGESLSAASIFRIEDL